MSRISKQKVVSGNIIRIKIDGKVVGRIQSIDGRRSFGQEPVHEIGSIMPQEHVPLRYEGSFTVDKFLIRQQSLVDLGLASLGEGILNMDIIDVEITDKYTNEVIRVYRGCSLTEYSERFQAGAISGENASFVYLRCDKGTPEAVNPN